MTAAGNVIMLGDGWRVRPLDQLQWVLDVRKQPKPGRLERDGGDWRPYAFCRTRAGLETALSRLRAEGVVLDPAPLASLPEYFPEPVRAAPAEPEPAP